MIIQMNIHSLSNNASIRSIDLGVSKVYLTKQNGLGGSNYSLEYFVETREQVQTIIDLCIAQNDSNIRIYTRNWFPLTEVPDIVSCNDVFIKADLCQNKATTGRYNMVTKQWFMAEYYTKYRFNQVKEEDYDKLFWAPLLTQNIK